MNILVIGAAGKTGQVVVQQAVSAGHTITAFVHHEESYTAPAGVTTFPGNVLDFESVINALEGQDAVLDTLGGHLPWKKTSLETNGARTVVEAMESTGVRRLVILSTIGEGDSMNNVHGWYGHLFMPTVLRGVMADKAGMEAVVEKSSIDWTIVRPAGLTDGESKGVRIVTPESGEKVRFITRTDVAHFMLDQITSHQYLHQAVGIANPETK